MDQGGLHDTDGSKRRLVADGTIAAQILFAVTEDDAVRCDVIVLDAGRWGAQALAAGTPISIRVQCVERGQQVQVAVVARAWSAAMAVIDLGFMSDGDQHYVVLAAGDEQLLLTIPRFA